MTTDLAPRPIDRFRIFLESALRQQDKARQVGTDKARQEHLLLSVVSSLSTFAPEFAVVYLVRKEARCQGGAIHWDPCKDRSFIDFCLVISGGYAASLEIKGPWGIWNSNNSLKNAAFKANPCISDVPTPERYNVWSLALQDETATEALEDFVRSKLKSLMGVVVGIISNPTTMNRGPKAISQYDRHRYEYLRVIVFNGVSAWCDGCRQLVTDSKLFSIGSGSIQVCQACRSQATAMIRQ
jgi:hypothetical protein